MGQKCFSRRLGDTPQLGAPMIFVNFMSGDPARQDLYSTYTGLLTALGRSLTTLWASMRYNRNHG